MSITDCGFTNMHAFLTVAKVQNECYRIGIEQREESTERKMQSIHSSTSKGLYGTLIHIFPNYASDLARKTMQPCNGHEKNINDHA